MRVSSKSLSLQLHEPVIIIIIIGLVSNINSLFIVIICTCLCTLCVLCTFADTQSLRLAGETRILIFLVAFLIDRHSIFWCEPLSLSFTVGLEGEEILSPTHS